MKSIIPFLYSWLKNCQSKVVLLPRARPNSITWNMKPNVLRGKTMVNFLFACSYIPAAHVYGVYISQLIRYSRVCGSYHDRGLLLTRKLLNQGLLMIELKSWLFRKSYVRHNDFVNHCEISVKQITRDMFRLTKLQSCSFFIHELSSGL
jgi:hypothetical protein